MLLLFLFISIGLFNICTDNIDTVSMKAKNTHFQLAIDSRHVHNLIHEKTLILCLFSAFHTLWYLVLSTEWPFAT